MTNEEAIKVLEQMRQYTDYPKEALTMAIEALSKSSLPSNLDKAAEEYALDVKAKPFGGLVKEAFNAGAELIAGQFQKIEGELVDWYSTSDGKDYCCGVRSKDAFEVPEGFYIKKK